jgi:hypothetical protein
VDLLSVEANCDLLLLGLTAGGGNGSNDVYKTMAVLKVETYTLSLV